MDNKFPLVLVVVIAIVAVMGLIFVFNGNMDISSVNNDNLNKNDSINSNEIYYNGFVFIIPEGFENHTESKELELNNSQGKIIEIRTEEQNITSENNPSILEFNNIKFNKYSDMEIAGSIEWNEDKEEIEVTSYIVVTVYTFTSNGKTFYILIEQGIPNPDEIVENMTAKNVWKKSLNENFNI